MTNESQEAMPDQPLLPCPFCGEKPELQDEGLPCDETMQGWANVVCHCDAHGPTEYGRARDETRLRAAEAWNRRAAQSQPPDILPEGVGLSEEDKSILAAAECIADELHEFNMERGCDKRWWEAIGKLSRAVDAKRASAIRATGARE